VSKHWGYVCVSHDPPLASERFGNHADDILRDIHRAHRAGTLAMEPEVHESGPFAGQTNYTRDYVALPMHHGSDHYKSTAPMNWLDDHPRCEIMLRSEYGDIEPIEAETT